jgi:hypothetical protein
MGWKYFPDKVLDLRVVLYDLAREVLTIKVARESNKVYSIRRDEAIREGSIYMVCCRCGFKGITGFGSPDVGSFFNVLSFLKKALKMCTNKPLVIVDEGSWYKWSLERLGLEYRYERFGIRNRVERFVRYLK